MSEAAAAVKLPPAQPPTVRTAAGTANEPPTICPETESPCSNGCKLPNGTGRTYCQKWFNRIRADILAEQAAAKGAKPQPGRD